MNEWKPITPFEPILSEEIPDGAGWIHQIKWDGVRILTYYDGREVRLCNRKRNERTGIFPELVDIQSYASAESVILDGEVIALDQEGKPSFHQVMRRDGIRRPDRVKQAIMEIPVSYMIFDILFYNGEWIHHRSLKERLELLTKVVTPNKRIQVVPTEKDGHALFDVIKRYNMEGIVSKDLSSAYIIKGKNASWRKIKNYRDLIAVIGGVTYRSGTVNSMLLGLYNKQNQFCYIGHAGTGKLTSSDWKKFTERIGTLKTTTRPFTNQPERVKNVQWIKPVITVKVQYIEWPEGHSLRQPSIQAFVREDPEQCRLQ
ncbi:DNA ligase [Sporolactobacillus sp. THM7-4]|nr:DNA ligase [Sporolactobacillus sp. THM7-4]